MIIKKEGDNTKKHVRICHYIEQLKNKELKILNFK